jgi:hypothetical protein
MKKILILASNPRKDLDLDDEIRLLRDVIDRSRDRDQFEIVSVPGVRVGDLQGLLLRHKPQIVHFCGHGGGEEGLIFKMEGGGEQWVRAEALAGLFRLHPICNDVKCVLLNACYSEEQANAIVSGIDYVVGMSHEIQDDAAIAFSKGFYLALGEGCSIDDAFEFGKSAIHLEISGSSKRRSAVSEAQRKLEVIDAVTNTSIPEHLKPILKKKATLTPDPSPNTLSQETTVEIQLAIDNTLRSVKSDISVVESRGHFYIVRDRLEKRCYEEILKPGMLIRIKSPDKMGKSFLMSRVLDAVSKNGYRTAIIDLREANQEIFADINQFLKWFCAYVSDQLNIDRSPEESWKKFLGANPNCTKYFETYLLSGAEEPLVIAINNFDCIFDHPNIKTDFCGLLRGWFEKVNANKMWGKLRQIIVYSQESYGTKDINQSPLNVGFPIEVGELDSLQVLALAKAYGLPWTEIETEKLMNMIGGHPYLVQMALDGIAHQDIVLDELLKIAPTEEGIYGDYLNERLQRLEENPALGEAIKKVVNADVPTHLGAKETFKLDSMGLIKRRGSDVVPRCNLYRLYFRDRLR